ncbi:MAG: YtxH domain-containing protein [Candidatus Eisenbacteria bacterium]
MNRNTVLGFALGAAVGGAVALLRAPNSGVETRRRVREKTGELSGQAKEKLSGTASTVKEHAVATKDTVKHGVETGLDVVKRNASAISDAASEGYRVYREQLEVASTNGHVE